MAMGVWKRLVVHKRVAVTLTSGTTLLGVIYEKRGPLLVLVDAAVVHETGDPLPADGQLVIETDRVDYIQIVG